ncbi:3-keto-5-aminohexanoate cleavage protein [Streptomyces sp. NPDC054854]
MIQACLNGRRTRNEHDDVPLTPQQLAAQAVAVAAEGASSIHMHPRDRAGRESLEGKDIEEAVGAVRAACRLPVGVSTGLWITEGDVSRRLELVSRWRPGMLPDFVSLNLSEPGFGEMAHVLAGMGVGVEAGVWSVADARLLLESPTAGSCVRVLVEVIGMPRQGALDEADRILSVLHGAGLPVPVLLHGDGDSTWPVLDRALARGLESRVGLEDVLTDAAGARVSGNVDLMRLARGRHVGTPGDGCVHGHGAEGQGTGGRVVGG